MVILGYVHRYTVLSTLDGTPKFQKSKNEIYYRLTRHHHFVNALILNAISLIVVKYCNISLLFFVNEIMQKDLPIFLTYLVGVKCLKIIIIINSSRNHKSGIVFKPEARKTICSSIFIP